MRLYIRKSSFTESTAGTKAQQRTTDFIGAHVPGELSYQKTFHIKFPGSDRVYSVIHHQESSNYGDAPIMRHHFTVVGNNVPGGTTEEMTEAAHDAFAKHISDARNLAGADAAPSGANPTARIRGALSTMFNQGGYLHGAADVGAPMHFVSDGDDASEAIGKVKKHIAATHRLNSTADAHWGSGGKSGATAQAMGIASSRLERQKGTALISRKYGAVNL